MKNGKKSKRRNDKVITTVGTNIKIIRKMLGLSQKQLDDLTGLRCYRHETGELDFSLTTLSIYSKALGVELHELLMSEDD